MKLICGMPRSGTKYLLNAFHLYGKYMKPEIWSHNAEYYTPWSTNEAEAISYAYFKGLDGFYLINLISLLDEVLKYEKSKDACIMYKQPQLCFLREELLHFNEIIICKRPVESWVKSVKQFIHIEPYLNKESRPYWLKKYEDRFEKTQDKYLTLGQIWEENANELIEFLNKRKFKYHVCEFGNVDHYRKLFKDFELSEEIINEYLKHWAGSKTDDKYKSFGV